MTPRDRILLAVEAHLRGGLAITARAWVRAKSDDNLITLARSVRDWADYVITGNEE